MNRHNYDSLLPLAASQRKRGPDKKVQLGEKCQVCAEQATGFNYGALTCNPCKSFFRRTILENNLTQRCDRGGNCDNRQIRRCIGCRLARCLAMGMKPDYIRQLRIKSIQRRIDKIPKDKQLLKFSETLDPFQENFLSVLEGFWLIYRDSATSTQEVSLISNERAVMQRTVSDVIADFGSKMSKFKLPNNNFQSKLAGLDYVKDYVDLHINMMRVFLEAIPSIRWHQLQEETKKQVVRYVTMEIPLVRGGSRFLCGISGNEENFAKAGVSPSLVEQMFGLIGRFVAMQPDTYETCLIAALCATSPDRGVRNQTDYKILSNIQETILEILRIKHKIDRKPIRHLAANIAFLQSLRSYSFSAENEWFKFISHKKKIVSSLAEVERGEEKRGGISFLIDQQQQTTQHKQQQQQALQTAYDQSVIHPTQRYAGTTTGAPVQMELEYPTVQATSSAAGASSSASTVGTIHRPSLISSLHYTRAPPVHHHHHHHHYAPHRSPPVGYASTSPSSTRNSGSPTSVIVPMTI